jgi:hypothetical protein
VLVAFMVLGWVDEGRRDRFSAAVLSSYTTHLQKRFDAMIRDLPLPAGPPAASRSTFVQQAPRP